LLEYPVWEIDLDAVWVEDLPVEIVGQSFAYESWLIVELQPARVEFEPRSATEAPRSVLPEVMLRGCSIPEQFPYIKSLWCTSNR
jgi:hypothetical protein